MGDGRLARFQPLVCGALHTVNLVDLFIDKLAFFKFPNFCLIIESNRSNLNKNICRNCLARTSNAVEYTRNLLGFSLHYGVGRSRLYPYTVVQFGLSTWLRLCPFGTSFHFLTSFRSGVQLVRVALTSPFPTSFQRISSSCSNPNSRLALFTSISFCLAAVCAGFSMFSFYQLQESASFFEVFWSSCPLMRATQRWPLLTSSRLPLGWTSVISLTC